MSEEEGRKSSGMLLQPRKKDLGDFLLPAALAAGGVALVYTATKGKGSKKSSSSSAPAAAANEVVFSKSYGSYSMGKDYESLTLEPYLAEQAEAGNLMLASHDGQIMGMIPDSMLEPMVAKSRSEIISAFKTTHHVKVGSEKVQISALPQDKTGVQKFNAWIESQVKDFQENY